MRKNAVLLFLLMVPATPSLAGTGLQAHAQDLTYKEDWADLGVSIDQNKIRIDFKEPWAQGFLLYDRETAGLTLVDSLKRTTLTLDSGDQATLKLLGPFALTIAQGQIEKGNGENRRIFELFRQALRLSFNGEPRLEAKGPRAAGLVCEKFVTEVEGKRAREVWTARADKTPMSGEDYNNLRSLFHLALDLLGGALTQLGVDPSAFPRLLSEPEIPMVFILYGKGKPTSRFEIKKITPQDFPAETFIPPADYQKIRLLDLLKPQPAKP